MAAVTPVIANPRGLVSFKRVVNPLNRGPNILATPPRFPESFLVASDRLFSGPIGVFNLPAVSGPTALSNCLDKNPGPVLSPRKTRECSQRDSRSVGL
jgi:hypothetical protein